MTEPRDKDALGQTMCSSSFRTELNHLFWTAPFINRGFPT